MKRGIAIVEEGGCHHVGQGDISAVLQRRFFLKTRSLHLASCSGVVVPPFLLAIDSLDTVLCTFEKSFRYPLMIRMDYEKSPKTKPIGGIPIFDREVLGKVGRFLYDCGFVPLIHPHLDRSRDEYSIGVLFSDSGDVFKIEAVGKGFDAGDLRLGLTLPHEIIEFDSRRDKVIDRKVISDQGFEKSTIERRKRIQQLNRYTEYANSSGRLLSDMAKLKSGVEGAAAIDLPSEYRPLSIQKIRGIASKVEALRAGAIVKLPYSSEFAASFSLVEGEGWILWDIYGHWYLRR